MLLTVEGSSPIMDPWADALAEMDIRHPNRESCVLLRLHDDTLSISLDRTYCTVTGAEKARFAIASVRLTYFPGKREAQAWLAAGFAGYVMHEALELVTVRGEIVVNPHTEPYPDAPANRTLRDGLPPALTPASLTRAMRHVT